MSKGSRNRTNVHSEEYRNWHDEVFKWVTPTRVRAADVVYCERCGTTHDRTIYCEVKHA
jgi:hypothetical protein